MRSRSFAATVDAAPPVDATVHILGWLLSLMLPTKAMVLPSGDQRGSRSPSSWSDILVSSPPSAGIVQTSVLRLSSNARPLRSDTKAILVPSGDHTGAVSFQSSPEVICFAVPLLMSTTQMWLRRSSNQPVSLNLYEICE